MIYHDCQDRLFEIPVNAQNNNIESAPKSIDRHECENGNVYVNYILS